MYWSAARFLKNAVNLAIWNESIVLKMKNPAYLSVITQNGKSTILNIGCYTAIWKLKCAKVFDKIRRKESSGE